MNIGIVTGASSGMGKEFAKKLDAENLDEIWAIALEMEGLESLQSEMKTKIVPMALDLTKETSFNEIQNKLNTEKPNVLWLVNASGFGKFGRYSDIKTEAVLNMIDLNCRGLVNMTEIVLPFMPNNSKIAQFGSVAAFQPVPFINVYSATKAFILSYSRSLNVELKPRQISVTTICPFWTKTQFFKRAVNPDNQVVKKYVVMYDANKVIEKAYKDTKNGKEISIYGFIANAQTKLAKILPHKLVMKIWCNQQKLK